ncbi:hypothetical protein PALB_30250 [Pseudoalteromonas luteoviolacea B = ATCC 29581]|nr:hypothetical protein PALB_30250 [Pseudoalteromonas luteoviolacea B = ATCC 29581]
MTLINQQALDTSIVNREQLVLFTFLKDLLRQCSGRLGHFQIRRDLVMSTYSASLMDMILHSSTHKAAMMIQLSNGDLNSLLKEISLINQALYLMPEQLLKNIGEVNQREKSKRLWVLRWLPRNLNWLKKPHLRHAKLIYPTFFDCLSIAKKNQRALS